MFPAFLLLSKMRKSWRWEHLREQWSLPSVPPCTLWSEQKAAVTAVSPGLFRYKCGVLLVSLSLCPNTAGMPQRQHEVLTLQLNPRVLILRPNPRGQAAVPPLHRVRASASARPQQGRGRGTSLFCHAHPWRLAMDCLDEYCRFVCFEQWYIFNASSYWILYQCTVLNCRSSGVRISQAPVEELFLRCWGS